MIEKDAHHFYATDMRVISADVHRGAEDAHDPMWEISYAEPAEDDDFRFVVGWLHCASEGIQVSVSVGAVVVDTGIAVEPDTKFEHLFQGSEALETVYQRACDAARILVALTDGVISFPKTAPPAEIVPLSNSDESTEPNLSASDGNSHQDDQ